MDQQYLSKNKKFITVEEFNNLKLINRGMIPSDSIETLHPNKKEDKKDDLSVIDTYEAITEAIKEVFINKNQEYGSIFLKFNRPLMRNEIKRKWERYETLFRDNDNTTEMVGSPDIIVPTMVDLANYAIMTILNEIYRSKNINGYGELYNILNDIVDAKDKIKIGGNGDE